MTHLVKLPTREALGGTPGLPSVPIARSDTTAAGRGLAKLGRSIREAAVTLEATGRQSQDFETERRFQEFQWDQQKQLDQSMREVSPGGADGFADRWAEGYKTAADEFARTVPDELRGKYDLRLLGTERQFYGSAATFARGEQKRHSLETINDRTNAYYSRASAGEPLDNIRSDYKAIIDANPYLTPIEKDGVLRKGYGSIEETHIEGRINRGESLDAILKDLRGEAREKPAGLVKAGNIDLENRPVVKNADGTISTIRSMSVNVDGKEVLIPTISDDGKLLPDDEAVRQYRRTGKHLGVFDTAANADAFAKQLSLDQERRYAASSASAQPALISVQLETGKTDPVLGVANISPDAGGTKSYGNFGLNSQKGGSIFTFAKDYGKPFGLTAKPGTKAFDDQWAIAAAAMPQELHEAEMAWYAEHVAGGIEQRLKKAGVPDALAGDARVQAYFADRFVQLGPGSIDKMGKHRRRIAAALEDADGDAAAFLQAMTEADRDALSSDFQTALRSGVYSAEGHDTRLDGRLRLAMGMPEAAGDAQIHPGPYAHLPADRRLVMTGKAKIASRNIALQDVKDGAAEIKRTGQPSMDDNGDDALERARRVLTKNQYEQVKIDWAEAKMEYGAFNDMDRLTEDELEQRLIDIEPKTGDEHYEIRGRIFDRAQRLADQIREGRDRDPAAAVSEFPEVQTAEQGVRENPGDPQFKQALIQARIDAQARIEIPEALRSPVTRAEARVILAPTRGLEDEALYESLKEVQAKLETEYGPYARAAAADIFAFSNRSRETAQELTSVLRRAFQDQPPTAAQQRRIEIVSEIDQATRAFGGDFTNDPSLQYYGLPETPAAGGSLQLNPADYYRMRKPPQKAIDALIANPDLAGEFDAYYGGGTSMQYLENEEE